MPLPSPDHLRELYAALPVRYANTLGRAGVTLAMLRQLPDAELRAVPNLGKRGVAAVGALVPYESPGARFVNSGLMSSNQTQLLVIPWLVSNGEFSLMIILQEGNIARLRDYDPVVIPVQDLPDEYRHLRLRDVGVTFASDEEVAEAQRASAAGEDMVPVLLALTRGYAFRPDLGNHDGSPEVLGSV